MKVKLLGELGRLFGRHYELDITTPSEAIRAIGFQKEGFIEYLNTSHEKGVMYKVITKGHLEGLTEEQLQLPAEEYVIIAPTVAGSSGGLLKGLLGVTLVAAALIIPGGVSLLGLSISSSTMGLLGASLILGGISSLLSPTPKKPKETKEDDRSSYIIDRAGTVVNQGAAVPVTYGEVLFTDPIPVSSGIVEETLSTGIDDHVQYRRLTQVQLPYKATAIDNYTYRFSNINYRPLNTDFVSNRDPYTGCVVDKMPYNRLAIKIEFSTTPAGLNIQAAYALQRVRIYTGVQGFYSNHRFEIWGSDISKGFVNGLHGGQLIANAWNELDLSPFPQFNIAYPVYTFIFFNDDPNVDHISLGELELYGPIGISESLANLKG